ncbi:MAG: Ferredoxin protein family [Candidatus Magnetoglobus multicellularis str. Araruama]|uniref:Ferredoxin protein family n=1 Tax=Candidatus Magnetoglobus multicellularis str. Araruama TaxID=890399 RepID=A0A1V1PEN4_9BACT|nr:MAG: Ferredoxin protein family [Candidatus Magnetoglobus multicellularis str. Araruama]
MKQHTITFLPYKKEVVVNDGENLIRAAMEAGVHINASCGGEGVCAKCRVLIEDGSIEDGISERLSQADIDHGYRLACKSIVRSDLVVRIPVESSIDTSVLNVTAKRQKATITERDTTILKESDQFLPPVERIFICVTEPSHEDNSSDASRVIRCLKDQFNEHRMEFDMPVLKQLPDVLRQGEHQISLTIARPVRDGDKNHIIQVTSGNQTSQQFAIAIDIGTTTVYGEILNTETGESLASYGDFNGQISYGEDVISRIVFAEKGDNAKTLQKVVVQTINKIIDKIIKKSKVDMTDISVVTLAGNTTMTQLLLGINPRYIRRSPYVPASIHYPSCKAFDMGLKLSPHTIALLYPCVSSYVGGDIVAGVMGSGMYQTDELTLFIDMGTNAEIVIGNKEWLTCAACSAGPAFEGGGVEHGMRASRGAIEDFSINPITFEPMVLTIGNVRPKGICGSGLLTMLAVLFENNVIGQNGKFNVELKTNRIRKQNDTYEYVVVWADQTQIERDIVLTEIDIDNLIRAKSAMYSGYMTLLTSVGLGIEDLDRIILAGGFGSYVDLEKAMTIGLLPEVDSEKVTYIGNASLMGARMCCLSNRIRQEVGSLVSRMTNFELSETPNYMDNYMAALFLPHTDSSLFPKFHARHSSFGESVTKID